MTTKREFEERAHYYRALQSLGFSYEECEKLRRISMTLRRWHELECGDGNGCIEREEHGPNAGRAVWSSAHACHKRVIPDREAGAKKRLTGIIAERNKRAFSAVHGAMQGCAPEWAREQDISAYIQTDPRGAALYILRPGDVPAGADAGAYYNRGICVY